MSKKENLISIIILNYNAGKLLLNCVESIKKSNYKNIEIIVVDNVSSDNSHVKCKEKYQEVKLIQNKENFGYCGGNNIGIKHATGEFVIILNPDTIVQPDCIRELVSAYQEIGEGLFQPKILSLNEENIIQSTGNMIHIFGFGFARDKGKRDNRAEEKIEKIGYASGTCLFTSRKIFEKIGLLDEFLFLYHDDLDLGWRATQLGIKSFYAPKARIFHAGSYNYKWSAKKFYWLERNRHYCLLTHYSKKTFYKMLPSIILVELMMISFYISKGFIKMKFSAYVDLLKNWKHIQ
ncbi:MAG: glycosyl transferase, partial [Chloroflexi bacterium]|nr:glycosyl transferase [Chloroflexota bacterium]